ncbi:hypothetical protein ACTXT7_012732 [Hymenolepis weldensis]
MGADHPISRATVTIQLDLIQWPVIWATFTSRALMFFVGILACLSISRGRLLGLGAIISLLMTDTNDIAVIYPTFRILYPLMAYHCCIIVALQILILKPIAFLLLEMNTVRERRMILRTLTKTSSTHMTYRTLFKKCIIVCQILLDPLVMAFAFGLIFNAVFHHNPPEYLTHFFNTFIILNVKSNWSERSETFVSCALFYLGLVCANSVTGVPAHNKPLLSIILSIKALLMPILATKLYHIFAKNSENASAECFTLLYSLSPANTNLLSLASRYAVTPNLVRYLMPDTTITNEMKRRAVTVSIKVKRRNLEIATFLKAARSFAWRVRKELNENTGDGLVSTKKGNQQHC